MDRSGPGGGVVIARWVDEWQAIPWTPRARRIGRVLEGAFILLALTAPAWVEGVVFKLVGP